ncbi:CRISPR-associated helicase/endonuclease Cas3 [Desulfofalx alkaliphila]|uniref:CRISPR-associated helicase/endonuclease Cas3 n=1 Tax=Desulfofalx alkaliphila TaxID=105483 RepID=UPI0004E1ADCE|nr:CRISPR-associated helicase/endonuclease Cas3 [Desulfofalx alkaliphila]
MKYYAHSTENPEKAWQTMVEHLEKTAHLAGKYAAEFNAQGFGFISGLLHDLGKYSERFQQKLRGASLYVDHSTAGAQEAINLYGELYGKLLAYCIAGHHSGLPDYGTAASTEGTLMARLRKKVGEDLEDYSAYKTELDLPTEKTFLNLPIKPIDNYRGFTISFFIRMIYSCLVDADYIDTESYMSDTLKPRGNNASIPQLNNTFNQFLTGFKADKTKINTRRQEILQRCLGMAKSPTGLFTLTVPTGGGKTLSSLAFALNHAVINNLKRIIYVIPYTSIIEQNAAVFKKVLGDNNILEHHSNYQFDNKDSEDIQAINEKLKLAAENWDIPIVVTTNVQFFESLFSNKSSKCRKIHNLAKSVIIFDEAQMLPVEYLKPCLLAISELVHNYRSTAVLCTATQPAIKGLLPSCIKAREIMDDPRQLYEDFKKVRVVKKGEIDDDTLADELKELDRVLCIVNTRKHAKEIYDKLIDNTFHLSTLMCPVHRQETLSEIRQRLRNKQACKVVSTQLIEAGVDVDFPVVYRSVAGIDSIVQSAGRCNREGYLSTGIVYVFKPVSEYAKIRGYLETTAKVADMVFRRYEDPISLDAIDYYFKMLYDVKGDEALDKEKIIKCFEERSSQLEFDFKTAAERFKLIESSTYSIIIPYNADARKLMEEAKYSPYPRSLARKLQPYTISVYENEYKALLKHAALKTVNNGFVVLDNFENNYDKRTGLIIPKDTYGEGIFI